MRLSAIIPQKSSIFDRNDAGWTVFYGHDPRNRKHAFRPPDRRRIRFATLRLRRSASARAGALEELGGGVVLYLALEAPINADNRRYMIAKAQRSRTPFRSPHGLAGQPVLGDKGALNGIMGVCTARPHGSRRVALLRS